MVVTFKLLFSREKKKLVFVTLSSGAVAALALECIVADDKSASDLDYQYP